MVRQGRILVVDDLEKWREELVETLRNGGFHAQAAATIEQALTSIEENLYHLLIIDINMDESEQHDESGIKLLSELKRRGLNSASKVIILTVYGTKPLMRTAFRDAEVVDFIEKDNFDNQEFLKNVQVLFAEKMNINFALDIQWQQLSGPEQAVQNLDTPIITRV